MLASSEVVGLIAELQETRWTGRPGYPIRSMIGMVLVKSLYALPTWTRTVALVREDVALREALGETPSVYACYRFASKLAQLSELVDRARKRAETKAEQEHARAETKAERERRRVARRIIRQYAPGNGGVSMDKAFSMEDFLVGKRVLGASPSAEDEALERMEMESAATSRDVAAWNADHASPRRQPLHDDRPDVPNQASGLTHKMSSRHRGRQAAAGATRGRRSSQKARSTR